MGSLAPLFQRRDDSSSSSSSSSSSLIEVRGTSSPPPSRREGMVGLPLLFREGVTALFHNKGAWHSHLSFREGLSVITRALGIPPSLSEKE